MIWRLAPADESTEEDDDDDELDDELLVRALTAWPNWVIG